MAAGHPHSIIRPENKYLIEIIILFFLNIYIDVITLWQEDCKGNFNLHFSFSMAVRVECLISWCMHRQNRIIFHFIMGTIVYLLNSPLERSKKNDTFFPGLTLVPIWKWKMKSELKLICSWIKMIEMKLPPTLSGCSKFQKCNKSIKSFGWSWSPAREIAKKYRTKLFQSISWWMRSVNQILYRIH